MERWRSGRLVNAVKSANAERKRQLLPSVQVLSRLLGLSVKAKFGCDRQQARNNNSVNETALPRTQTGVSTPSPEAASYRWSLRHPQHGLRLADPPAAPGAPSRAQDEGQSGQEPLPLLKDPSCNQHGCSLPPRGEHSGKRSPCRQGCKGDFSSQLAVSPAGLCYRGGSGKRTDPQLTVFFTVPQEHLHLKKNRACPYVVMFISGYFCPFGGNRKMGLPFLPSYFLTWCVFFY